MLDPNAFEQWCAALRVAGPAREFVSAVRSAGPSRGVRGSLGNVVGRFPSRKMGVTVQFESHKVELPVIFELEHDPDVLEYFDQPPPIELSYLAPSGRAVRARHTPDFFVLRTSSAEWVECKPEARLRSLAVSSPARYVFEDGRWRCPPGERAAAAFGFSYRLRSSAEIDWTRQRNLRFLADYLAAPERPIEEVLRERILALVPERGFLSLAAMLGQVEPRHADDLYALIAHGDLYVDLSAEALAEPSRVRVFRSEAPARDFARSAPASGAAPTGIWRVGQHVIWGGRRWRVANVGERAIGLLDAERNLVELAPAALDDLVRSGAVSSADAPGPGGEHAREFLNAAHPDDLAEALARLDAVERYRRGEGTAPYPLRTVQAWGTSFRRAETVYGVGLVGLLPRRRFRGNRAPKLAAETRALIDEIVPARYDDPRQVVRARVHEAIVVACERRGITPPSYKTVCTEIHKRLGPEQVGKRAGKRAAYQIEPFVWELERTTPRHGDRPFEIVHIDHTELDVELVDSEIPRQLGRPWATICTDAYSRRLLAIVCLFDPPSYRSCMMVLRELVRRHNRFPETVVIDNGKEFDSVYFETLLARFHCTKKSRPAGAPRFGSVCERLFGTSGSELVHTLRGNTQIARGPRPGRAGEVPKQQAVWTLPELARCLREWAYEVYDTREHVSLAESPREAFARALARTGQRPFRAVAYDETFRMLTLPSTPKGTARVIAGRGVQIRKTYYWAVTDVFRSPHVEGTDVPVRYDPFDAGVAFAYVDGRWARCISEHYAAFRGRSEREIELASIELRRRREGRCRRRPEAVRQLATFLESAEAAEALQLQRLRDRETRAALADVASEEAPTASSEAPVAKRPSPRSRTSRKTPSGAGPMTEYEAY